MTSSLQVSSASTIELFSELNWVSSSSNIDLASFIGTGPITTEKSFLSNFSTSTEVETVQWQTAGKVKIQTENYNIFQNLFNLISSTLIRESGF